MILLPIHTDAHPGKLGMAALGIVVVCFVVHLFVTADTAATERRVTAACDSLVQYRQQEEVARRLADTANYGLMQDGFLSKFDSLYSQTNFTVQQLGKQIREGALDPYKAVTDSLQLSIAKTSLMFRLGLVLNEFSIVSLLTHMFVHQGWMHLLFNLWFFYICGLTMEKYWGLWKFLGGYLGCGIAAALSFFGVAVLAGAQLQDTPLVGASGAIAGTMGAFMVTHRHAKVKLFFLFGFRPRIFDVPAVWFFGFWIVTQIFYALMTLHGASGVAYTAHVGGFAVGAVLGMALKSADEAALVEPSRPLPARPAAVRPAEALRPIDEESYMTYRNAPSLGSARTQLENFDAGREGRPSVQQPSTPALDQAMACLGRGEHAAAAPLLMQGLDLCFRARDPRYNPSIVAAVGAIVKNAKELPLDPKILYHWGKHLAQTTLTPQAVLLLETAARKSSDPHTHLNCLLHAADLRVKTRNDLDRAAKQLQYVMKHDARGVLAPLARQRLDEIAQMGAPASQAYFGEGRS